MTQFEELTRQAELMAAQMSEGMAAWAKAWGIPTANDRGYIGARCGWYPEKPRRKRRVTLR